MDGGCQFQVWPRFGVRQFQRQGLRGWLGAVFDRVRVESSAPDQRQRGRPAELSSFWLASLILKAEPQPCPT
jgi:hypothetical protein